MTKLVKSYGNDKGDEDGEKENWGGKEEIYQHSN